MIHYHGLPITPETAAAQVLKCGHAFVSFYRPDQIGLAVELCQSFALDNGAFSAWKSGSPVRDWGPFYEFASKCASLPSCDWAVIPDVIDGNEADNDRLVSEWPMPRRVGVPVWHMHESLGRLDRLVGEWPRICLGSSGEYTQIGTPAWWSRMGEAMDVACDADGAPRAKLHGLRMLNPYIFSRLPLASADSTNIARNVGNKTGPIGRPHINVRASLMREQIEAVNSATHWDKSSLGILGQVELWA